MKCHRCGGVMVCERIYGPDEHFLGWRCLQCGEIIDEVILENRQVVGGRKNGGMKEGRIRNRVSMRNGGRL